MAGGGALPGRATDQTNAEIYSPPYLFKGPRPTITLGTRRRELRLELRRHDAERRVDREGLARSGRRRSRTPSTRTSASSSSTSRPAPGSSRCRRRPTRTSRRPATTCCSSSTRTACRRPDRSSASRRRATSRRRPRRRASPPRLRRARSSLTWNAVDRSERDRELQRPPLDDAGLHAQHRATASPSRPGRATPTSAGRRAPTTTRSPRTTHAGNSSAPSNEVTAVVPSGPLPGLVAAYGFDEGTGHHDARTRSGNGNNGTVANTTWSARRQVRQGPLLQRNERLGDRQRLDLARPDHRDDRRGLGQPDDPRQRLPDGRLQGRAWTTRSTRSTATNPEAHRRRSERCA